MAFTLASLCMPCKCTNDCVISSLKSRLSRPLSQCQGNSCSKSDAKIMKSTPRDVHIADNRSHQRIDRIVFSCTSSERQVVAETEPEIHVEGESSKVKAVLFDMDGVLCDSEDPSRQAAVELFLELGFIVQAEDFIPFMGTGEANFLGGVAHKYDIENFDTSLAKKRFFEIYIEKYARPGSGIGYRGALELILKCKEVGLKLAVASSADRIKVIANLAAAGFAESMFDAIISADSFERLKPAPDVFLAAANALSVAPSECVVIEDALAGVQAAHAAGMRCIAVTTTLSEGDFMKIGPAIIKKDIGQISYIDIVTCQDKNCKIET